MNFAAPPAAEAVAVEAVGVAAVAVAAVEVAEPVKQRPPLAVEPQTVASASAVL